MLFRHPGLSAITIAALALGIGFTAIMFGIVHAVLIGELPVEDGGRIVRIGLAAPSAATPGAETTIHEYADWRAAQRTFEELAAYREGSANVRGPAGPFRYRSAWLTANALTTLGIEPEIGRLFREEDGGPDAVRTVILSHRVREELFGASAEAVGNAVTVNGEPAEIIGVLPEEFRFPYQQDIWLPLPMDPPGVERGAGAAVSVFGRLRAGVGRDEAAAELTGIVGDLHATYPETSPDATAVVESFVRTPNVNRVAPLFWAILVVASLLLLAACANAANLLLLRAAARARETGIRRAMGARGSHIAYRLLAAATVLALLGGLLGAGIARIGTGLFAVAAADAMPPFWVVFEFDRAVFLFIMAVTGVAILTAGIPPAVKATGHDADLGRRDESGGSSPMRTGRLSRWMVVGELAMSMGLLVAAGLMTRSLATLNRFDYGFAHDGVFTARVTVARADLPSGEDRRRFFQEVLDRVEGIPGVETAALGTSLPALGTTSVDFAIEDGGRVPAAGGPMASWVQVSPGYFSVFGVGVEEGRGFVTDAVADSAAVAIVNRSFASRYLGEDPVGKRIRVGGSTGDPLWRTVVGVVPDLHLGGVDAGSTGSEGVYTPLLQGDESSVYVVAAGPADPLSLTSPVGAAVVSANANTPIHDAIAMSDLLARETLFHRIFGTLFVALGFAALFLAAVGVYVVVSFSVRQWRTELGVRMILGAGATDILRLILGKGLAPMGCGVVLGAGVGLMISRSLRLALFGISPYDPLSFATAAGLLIGVGILAAAIPALLATRIDPVAALRAK